MRVVQLICKFLNKHVFVELIDYLQDDHQQEDHDHESIEVDEILGNFLLSQVLLEVADYPIEGTDLVIPIPH